MHTPKEFDKSKSTAGTTGLKKGLLFNLIQIPIETQIKCGHAQSIHFKEPNQLEKLLHDISIDIN